MAVRFTMINQDNSDSAQPTASPNTYTQGVNAPGGPVEFFMCHWKGTWAADAATGGFGNLINTFRIVLNGEVVFDFRAGYASNSNEASIWQYFLNSIGGRSYEDPSGTVTRDYWVAIPLGRQTPSGVNRYEVVIGYAAAADAISTGTGTLEFWLQTNDAMQKTTTVCPSTSFTHAASIEMVTVKVPQNVPGVVSALLVQNDSAADQLGSQGIRINALSDFGQEPGMTRFLNGDWNNGIKYAGSAIGSAQTLGYQIAGALVIPVYGLTGGDIIVTVDSSSATTRTYTPIITNSVGAREAQTVRQTQAAPGNTANAILSRTLE